MNPGYANDTYTSGYINIIDSFIRVCFYPPRILFKVLIFKLLFCILVFYSD